MNIPTIKNLKLKNKSVLLRIDINSPVVKSKILNNPRFEASAKTIKYLLDKDAKVTIIAHQGRKGDKDFTSLEQHAKILSKYVKSNIKYIPSLFEEKAKSSILSLKSKQAVLLKNVREYEDETNLKLKDNRYPKFCKLFDIYVNEAFSVSHRAQGSIIIPPKYLKSVIGLECESEIKALEKFKKSKAKSKVFILGGSKAEDYFPLFNFLKNKNNKLLAAGVLANLFLIAKGYNLGYESQWLKQNNFLPLIPKLKSIYTKYENQIILPLDFAFLSKEGKRVEFTLENAPFKYKIYDVGKNTLNLYKDELRYTDYIFMKGPLGFSEIREFSFPTVSLLKTISSLTKNKKLFSLLGGGHLNTTIKKHKIPKNFSYNSLSGGALIKYISGEKLPGIEAIKNKKWI
ncbi:MAG: phosphoglycerate kinase [Nanoarchaeota archaeon]|nr:phosphoglycerate kinase [Nanoarchaeota archaeon]